MKKLFINSMVVVLNIVCNCCTSSDMSINISICNQDLLSNDSSSSVSKEYPSAANYSAIKDIKDDDEQIKEICKLYEYYKDPEYIYEGEKM